MREERVRELAHDALVHLAPVTAPKVEDDWRGQIADYVLGQQSGPESTATRGHLRRSEQARAWAGSLLDSLETLYGERALPSIPAGATAAGERARRRGRARAGAPRARALARRPGRRVAPPPPARDHGAAPRRSCSSSVLVWPVGLLGPATTTTAATAAATPRPTASRPRQRGTPAGIAIVADRNGERQVIVQAAGLDPSRQREAYEVWLYNSPEDAKSLGAQVTDSQGSYQGAGPLPEDFENYEFIDVSREPINDDGKHSGQSVLRGKFGEPARAARQRQARTRP